MSSPSDADLIRRFVEDRDEDAFAELVRRHIDLVYRAALRRAGDAHRAQDIVQAVFIALAWKASALLQHETIVGWLHTATRFAANDILRAERRRRIWEQEASRMPQTPSDHSTPANWEELRPVIDDALGELGEHEREIVLLRFFSGHSFASIGATLRVSENTARMRVERALDKLHAPLVRRGITSTSTALGAALAQQSLGAAVPVSLAGGVTATALSSTAAGTSQVSTVVFAGIAKKQLALGAVAAVLTGVALYQNFVSRRDEAQASEIVREIATEAGNLGALQRDLMAAKATRATLQTHPTSPRGSTSDQTAAPMQKSQLEIIRDQYLRRRAVARSDPEYQRIQRERNKWGVNQEYRPLLQRLKLSPERVAQFESLLADHQYALDEIRAAAEAQEVKVWDPAIRRLEADEREKLAMQMRALLGDTGYADYKGYELTLGLRLQITDQVAAALYATDVPLTAIQAEALTQLLSRYTPIGAEGAKREADLDWAAVSPEAKRLLAPLQYDALEAVRAQFEWSQLLAVNLSPLVGTMPPAKTPGK